MSLLRGVKNLIQITDTYAELEMTYHGTVLNGMLLWLDEHLIKEWWKLSDAKIEPVKGGIFYLRWSSERKGTHVFYGVMDEVNTEDCFFKVSKIIYINNEDKMGQLDLHICFKECPEKQSVIKIRLSHTFDPVSKIVFDKGVLLSWPRTFDLFKKFVEN